MGFRAQTGGNFRLPRPVLRARYFDTFDYISSPLMKDARCQAIGLTKFTYDRRGPITELVHMNWNRIAGT
jgi:hypothetical protein